MNKTIKLLKFVKAITEGNYIYYSPPFQDLESKEMLKHLMDTDFIEQIDLERLNTLAYLHGWEVSIENP